MKKLLVFTSCVIVLLIMAGCGPNSDVEVKTPDTTIQLNTPGPNPEMGKPAENGRVAGILQGLWHGLISPITLIWSFFNANVHIYEVHNVGKEYDLGYLLGVAVVFLFLGFTGRRWR